MTKDTYDESQTKGSSINLIVGTVFFAILLWGPTEPLYVRILSLTLIPITLILVLKHFGGKWLAKETVNNKLFRGVAVLVLVLSLLFSYSAFTANSHSQCTQSARTYDGIECVGDYVEVSGPDKGAGLMWIMVAGFAGYVAFSKNTDE